MGKEDEKKEIKSDETKEEFEELANVKAISSLVNTAIVSKFFEVSGRKKAQEIVRKALVELMAIDSNPSEDKDVWNLANN